MNFDVNKYLTPYKYGKPVLTGSGVPGNFDSQSVDIPFVFWHNNMFYMVYTGFDGIGYQTALATSKGLLMWEHKAVILKRSDVKSWDNVGASATWVIKKNDDLFETPELLKFNGKYWLFYHSYPSSGYEEGPAEIGLAWTEDEELVDWHRLPSPVFSWKYGCDWEKGGLYKSCIINNNGLWYMFYNAKDASKRWGEQTGLATSTDLINWKRYEGNPVLKVTENAWDERFVSDPCVLRDGGRFLNFFFGYGKGHAQEGLAYSDDLENWTKLDYPILTSGTQGEIDDRHAHKASVVYYNETLYHFYCAVRVHKEGDKTKVYDEFRTITVAASKPF